MSDRLAELGPLIDAGPTREHLARLQSFGLSVRTLHRLSGVSMKSLASLIWGVEGREPSGQVRQETADRIMAVRPRFELLSPVAKIGVTGTQRRVQALQVVGWSPLLIAAVWATGCVVGYLAPGDEYSIWAVSTCGLAFVAALATERPVVLVVTAVLGAGLMLA